MIRLFALFVCLNANVRNADEDVGVLGRLVA